MSISEIFSNINPEDFMSNPHVHERKLLGETFDEFVDRNLHAVRYAFASSDGKINPIVALGTPMFERLYVAQDDETLRDLMRRMRERAASIGAERFFFQRLTRMQAVEDGAWHGHVVWYAKDATISEERYGNLPIMSDNELGESIDMSGFDTVDGLAKDLRRVV